MEDKAMPNTDFAFDLFRECVEEMKDKNVAIALPSITKGLAMILLGARGDTADEIRQVLKWAMEDPSKSFVSSASSVKENTKGKTTSCTMVEAQRIYVDSSFTLKPEFVSGIQEEFASQAVTADFRNNPEGERKSINDWMLQQTQGKISDLLPKGSVSSSTAMLLAQGVTYDCTWTNLFDARNTQQASFFAPSGVKQVPMMHQVKQFNYGQQDGNTAVELPYSEVRGEDPPPGDISMAIVLEDPEKKLDHRTLMKLLTLVSIKEVDLKMPRFRNETTVDLKEPLIRLGMHQTFGDEADFSGITDDGHLTFSSYAQAVVVEVNEQGTDTAESQSYEAAGSAGGKTDAQEVPTCSDVAEAAGSAGGKTDAQEMPTCSDVTFVADYPFLYYIIQRLNGDTKILMSGRVTDP